MKIATLLFALLVAPCLIAALGEVPFLRASIRITAVTRCQRRCNRKYKIPEECPRKCAFLTKSKEMACRIKCAQETRAQNRCKSRC